MSFKTKILFLVDMSYLNSLFNSPTIGHSFKLQFFVSTRFPTHSLPPLEGLGFVQVLLRLSFPGPQDAEHGISFHSVNPP